MKFRYFKFPLLVRSDDIANDGYGILGQKGFFDIFSVTFDYQKEEIELKQK